MRSMHRAAVAALLVASLAAPAAAQQNLNVTQSDIQRLQDNVYLADRDVSQMRSRDSARATQLQTELDDLRDEVVYLKVKLRKERALARTEYADVRDRIEDLRTRARAESANAYTPPPASSTTTSNRGTWQAPPASRDVELDAPRRRTTAVEVPSGTEVDVRLQNSLNSGTAQVEDRFEGTTLVDLERQRPHRDSGRIGDARRRDGGRARHAHESHGADDGQLRPGHRERPHLSVARHGDAGDRGRGHQGRSGSRPAQAPRWAA